MRIHFVVTMLLLLSFGESVSQISTPVDTSAPFNLHFQVNPAYIGRNYWGLDLGFRVAAKALINDRFTIDAWFQRPYNRSIDKSTQADSVSENQNSFVRAFEIGATVGYHLKQEKDSLGNTKHWTARLGIGWLQSTVGSDFFDMDAVNQANSTTFSSGDKHTNLRVPIISFGGSRMLQQSAGEGQSPRQTWFYADILIAPVIQVEDLDLYGIPYSLTQPRRILKRRPLGFRLGVSHVIYLWDNIGLDFHGEVGSRPGLNTNVLGDGLKNYYLLASGGLWIRI